MKNCKCTFTKDVQASSTATWLFAVCAFLLGIIVGFLCSPVKKGMTIGCNNGNSRLEKDYFEDDFKEDDLEF